MTTERTVTFPSRAAAAFVQEVKTRVGEYFDSTGRSTKADWRMIARIFTALGLCFIPYALILSNRFSALEMLGLALVMGVGLAGIGFGISHDALHGGLSSSNAVNYLFGLTFDLLGANGYMWKITHNVVHHTYTNIQGIDEDLEVSPLLRLSPRSEHKPFHRYQHLYAFAAYSFSTIFWVFVKDYKYFLAKDIGPYQDKHHPWHEWAVLIGGKLAYYSWAIVIPLVVLTIPWWQTLIGYVVMNLTAGLILGVVFQLAHVVEGVDHLAPDGEGRMEYTWLAHEMMTTANFAPTNRLLTWYVGGLNHQIEHHLFPKMCSVHYPEIRPIVQDAARKHGIPYNEAPTLFAAMGSHYRTLKKYGQGYREEAPAAVRPQAAAQVPIGV
ncbi:MAG: fatty acid desaturase family protein [Gemmatimonadales bacterium]